jgi:hypothetical protein
LQSEPLYNTTLEAGMYLFSFVMLYIWNLCNNLLKWKLITRMVEIQGWVSWMVFILSAHTNERNVHTLKSYTIVHKKWSFTGIGNRKKQLHFAGQEGRGG